MLVNCKGAITRDAFHLHPHTPTRRVQAKAGKKDQKEPEKKNQSFLSQFTDAIDFSQIRSDSDRDLLEGAKKNLEKGDKGGERQKMSQEQYLALRRKVGGTAKDFWKESVEASETKGYRSSQGASVPGLPFLLAVIAGVVIATVVVTSQTAGGQAPPASQPSPQPSAEASQ